MQELKGRTITGIQLDSRNQHYLEFETKEGTLIYNAQGDCCSESYFSELLNVRDMLAGRPVTEVEILEAHDAEKATRQECDTVYGVRLHFGEDQPVGIVTMRNSSNGYYGGEWVLVGGYPSYAANFKHDEPVMRPVTEDYQSDA